MRDVLAWKSIAKNKTCNSMKLDLRGTPSFSLQTGAPPVCGIVEPKAVEQGKEIEKDVDKSQSQQPFLYESPFLQHLLSHQFFPQLYQFRLLFPKIHA